MFSNVAAFNESRFMMTLTSHIILPTNENSSQAVSIRGMHRTQSCITINVMFCWGIPKILDITLLLYNQKLLKAFQIYTDAIT